MDFTGLIFIAFGLTYVGGLVYLANQVESTRFARVPAVNGTLHEAGHDRPLGTILRWMLYGLIAMMFSVGMMVFQAALLGDVASEVAIDNQALQLNVGIPGAVATFALSIIACVLSFQVVSSERFRLWLQRVIGNRGSYNPNSRVHNVAVVLVLAVVVWTVASFVLQGGISGMADDLEINGIDTGDLLFQAVLEVAIALLGVGLAIRRGWSETMERLGLRLPTREDVTWGVGVGLACIVLMLVFNFIWVSVTSPEIVEEQTAATMQLNQLFSTIPMAFVLAITAAVGEEIWVRGALQPVFGILITSIFFVVLHTQVALTPGTFVIFIVALALGWLRQRHSTTAAIFAHFIFNFIPLALLSMTPV